MRSLKNEESIVGELRLYVLRGAKCHALHAFDLVDFYEGTATTTSVAGRVLCNARAS